MISEKALRAAAEELNTVLGLDPAIPAKKGSVEVLTDKIREAATLIDPEEDEFTKETQKVLDELVATKEDDDDDEEEEKAPAKGKGKKATAKEEPEDDDEDEDEGNDDNEDEDEDEEESLSDQVENADKLGDLKTLVNDNDEFKSLRKKLATYKKADDLREVMLAILEELEEEEAETSKKTAQKLHDKNVGSKKASVGKGKKDDDDDDEEEEKAPAKKKGPIKKAGEEGKPGIIQTIVSLVENAGKKGISKKDILAHLIEEFPDRNEVSMKNTINVKLPARINKEKFPVKKVGEDRYTKA